MGRLFIVRTNQRSLKYLLEQRLVSEEYQKWLTKLIGYDFEIQYRPKKDNSVVDALPRRAKSVEYKALSVPSVYYWDELLKDLERDAELEPLWKKDLEEDGLCTWYTMEDVRLLYKNMLVLPRTSKWIPKLFLEFHSNATGGHKGNTKNYHHIASELYLSGMRKVIERMVSECVVIRLHGVPKAMVTDQDKVEYWYNTSYHTSSKATPFKILYGRDPPKIIPYETSSAPTFEVDKYLEELDRVLDYLRKNLLKAQQIMKAWSDSHQRDVQFLVGDMEVLGVQEGKRNSKEDREILIRWKSLPEYESTWEPFQLIHNQFPDFHLEDKVLLWEGGRSSALLPPLERSMFVIYSIFFLLFGRLLQLVQLGPSAASKLLRKLRMECMSSASFGMNMPMFASRRDRLRISSEPLGVEIHIIACTLSGSALIPSFVTMYPRNLPSSILNAHLLGSIFTFILFNLFSISSTY
ncbi:putative mitochondrial protein [Tanacetum coccineum]|uniref:Mitochondrial protein n=1 Tax=Tanacetum coccineum TaxID=301880 RepID=A0ABQ5AGX7_9ASTR